MLPILLLGAGLLILATSRKSSAAPVSATNALPGVERDVQWTYLNDYKDSNGVVWNISETGFGKAYRGIAGAGKYTGKTFRLPTWPILKTIIDTFAQTERMSAGLGGLGGLGTQLGLTGPPGIPEDVEIAPAVIGALAPIEVGERVTFEARTSDVNLGRMEGRYEGPVEDPSEGPARMVVDRVAFRSSETPLPLGTYMVPASASIDHHDKLSRVQWTVFAPKSVGLSTFATPPSTPVGTFVTVVVADRVLTKVVAIAQVTAVAADGSLTLRLIRPYRVMQDSGSGPITFPSTITQNVLQALPSDLVNPASLVTASN